VLTSYGRWPFTKGRFPTGESLPMINGPADLTQSAHVDFPRKRIYLVFEGFLSPVQAQQLKDAYRDAIASVGPGYTVLSYFKDFTPGTQEVAELFAAMVEMASAGGCRKAARVSSGSVLGPLQMSRIATSHASYPSRQFETWAGAEAYLNEEAT
jgi:hypothetical protein